MTGIILAGGKRSRIGKNKALLKIGEKQVIKLIVEKLRIAFGNVLVVANSSFDYQFLGVRVVQDIVSKRGPLGGIYTGLVTSQSEYNFICGCDMPFLNVDLLRFMSSQIDDSDVIVPVVKGFVEPLHSIYAKRCLPAIRSHLKAENLKVKNFFPEVTCKYLSEDKIKKYDSQLLSFFNLNTPRLLGLATSERSSKWDKKGQRAENGKADYFFVPSYQR